MSASTAQAHQGLLGPRHGEALKVLESPRVKHFDNPAVEWRRLFSELFGTFLLILAGAGGGVTPAVSNGAINRSAAVTATGLTVMAVILFIGAILPLGEHRLCCGRRLSVATHAWLPHSNGRDQLQPLARGRRSLFPVGYSKVCTHMQKCGERGKRTTGFIQYIDGQSIHQVGTSITTRLY